MKVKTITALALCTALLCILAPISVPIGIVPITLATLGVYIVSGLFNFKKAPVAIVLYIVLGIIGLPVFSNGQSGIAVIGGPTGGYILGYILCAIIEPIIIQLCKGKIWSIPLGMIAGTLLIYVFGTAWFLICMNYIKMTSYSFGKAMSVCVLPFLPGDAIKIVLATLIVYRLQKSIKSINDEFKL